MSSLVGSHRRQTLVAQNISYLEAALSIVHPQSGLSGIRCTCEVSRGAQIAYPSVE